MVKAYLFLDWRVEINIFPSSFMKRACVISMYKSTRVAFISDNTV